MEKVLNGKGSNVIRSNWKIFPLKPENALKEKNLIGKNSNGKNSNVQSSNFVDFIIIWSENDLNWKY